ncbi:MAG: glycosyltransferase family 4 protein [Patescibacteria group bacterium]|nr:glycosyltransferase family 4 protein [Patescibacteria group bacterium]
MPVSKTKIVVLSAFYDPFISGAEQMVKELVERLGDVYEISLVTARLDKNLPKEEERKNFKIIRVGIGHKQIDKALFPLLANRPIIKIKPKIIHAIMESYAGIALVFSKYFYKKAKRILTLQSGDLDDPKKQKKFLIRFFWKSIHKSPDRITAISSFLADRARRLGVADEKIQLIPNGVDFSKVPQGIIQEKNKVVCLARLSWEKGLDYLVKAWPGVISQVPEAKLVLVGEGDKRKEIEDLIKELNIAGSVELKGALPHQEALEQLASAEVFICPSLAEGLGIVFIEAQACGAPVIGTRVGGIPDVIQDNENGLLVEAKNSEQITEAIVKLLKDEELRKQLSARASVSVRKYDWQPIIDQVRELYERA